MMATRWTIQAFFMGCAILWGLSFRCHGQNPIIKHNPRRLRYIPYSSSQPVDLVPPSLRNVPRFGFDLDDDMDDIRTALFSMSTDVPAKPGTPAPDVVPVPTPSPVTPATAAPVTQIPPTPMPTIPSTPPPSSLDPTTASPIVVPSAGPTTTPPAEPPTRDDRDMMIEAKCGVTALERSRDILAELLKVSSANALVNPATPEYQGREWIDNIDPAIICPNSPQRIHQRYRVTLLYYHLGGANWTRCSAEDRSDSDSDADQQDGNATTTIADPNSTSCPGVPFLDERNECEWYGMSCGEGYDPVVSASSDAYFPLQEIEMPSNNLVGTLFDELYGFEQLHRLNLQGNERIGGTISEEIGGLAQLKELDLADNALTGPLPDALFDLSNLISLYLNDNTLTGGISNDIGELGNVTMVQLQYNSFDGTVPEEGLFFLERLGTNISAPCHVAHPSFRRSTSFSRRSCRLLNFCE
jgi:hypothetical protein